MSLRRWVLAALLCSSLPTAAVELRAGDARLSLLLTDPAIDEISGLAASRRHADILWTHNDSGNTAEVHAIHTVRGRVASFRLANARNIDWEDIALFEEDGRHWLVIADTGDNGGIREVLDLHFVPEPDTLAEGELQVLRTLRFRWPDGARDCEAMAVDLQHRAIYLVSKKRVPPELFRLPLDGDSSAGPLVAEKVGLVQHVSQPTQRDLERNPVFGRYRAQITGMDISPNGRMLAVLNYLQARIYIRHPDEPWADALARPPIEARFPWMAQAEGIAFAADGGSLWIGTERLPAPLIQIPLGTR